MYSLTSKVRKSKPLMVHRATSSAVSCEWGLEDEPPHVMGTLEGTLVGRARRDRAFGSCANPSYLDVC